MNKRQEGHMRRSIPAGLIAGFVLAAVLAPSLSGQAGPKIVVLPRGTTVESLAPGHLRLRMPEGCSIELKGYQKARGTATIGAAGSAAECWIKGVAGKLVALGGEARIVGGLTAEEAGPTAAGDAEDFLKIDGEVTRLPARLEFQATRVFNRLALAKLGPPSDAVAK
jgi:hypothetical protein